MDLNEYQTFKSNFEEIQGYGLTPFNSILNYISFCISTIEINDIPYVEFEDEGIADSGTYVLYAILNESLIESGEHIFFEMIELEQDLWMLASRELNNREMGALQETLTLLNDEIDCVRWARCIRIA